MRVYSTPLATTYHANPVSCASCCSLLYAAALLFVPWTLAFAVGGFWAKESFVRERPLVRFTHEVLVEGFGATSSERFGWSTSGDLNAALGDAFRSCELRTWSDDFNRDGSPEALHFKLSVPLASATGNGAPLAIHSFSILVGLEAVYSNEAHSPLSVTGVAFAQASSPLAGARWSQRGDLLLDASAPLEAYTDAPRPACDTPFSLLQQPVGEDGLAQTAHDVLARYAACNDTIRLVPHAPLWTPGAADSFEAELTVAVPSANVFYRPSVAELLKLAWVQYLALFFPCYWLLSGLLHACVQYGVITTRSHHPIKGKSF